MPRFPGRQRRFLLVNKENGETTLDVFDLPGHLLLLTYKLRVWSQSLGVKQEICLRRLVIFWLYTRTYTRWVSRVDEWQ